MLNSTALLYNHAKVILMLIDYNAPQTFESYINIKHRALQSYSKRNRRAVRQRTTEGANHWMKQQGSKCTNQSCWKTTNHSRASCFIRSRMTSRPHRLKKTSSMQSKRRDFTSHVTTRETNEKLSFYCYSPRWITTTFFTKIKWVFVVYF